MWKCCTDHHLSIKPKWNKGTEALIRVLSVHTNPSKSVKMAFCTKILGLKNFFQKIAQKIDFLKIWYLDVSDNSESIGVNFVFTIFGGCVRPSVCPSVGPSPTKTNVLPVSRIAQAFQTCIYQQFMNDFIFDYTMVEKFRGRANLPSIASLRPLVGPSH